MSKTVKSKGKKKVRYRHTLSQAAWEARDARYRNAEDRELAVKERNAASLEAFAKALTIYAEAVAFQGRNTGQ
jgi:hypothetical protein